MSIEFMLLFVACIQLFVEKWEKSKKEKNKTKQQQQQNYTPPKWTMERKDKTKQHNTS